LCKHTASHWFIDDSFQNTTKNNGRPVEVDTDGVICELPEGMTPIAFNNIVQKDLSLYTSVEIEPEYGDYIIEKMFMYKEKTYAYFKDNELILVGSAFKNRSEPEIFKQFIRTCITHLLNDDRKKVQHEYEYLYKSIEDCNVDIQDLARTVRIGKSLDDYKELSRKKLPQYEVWINAGMKDVDKHTPTTFYKTSCPERFKLSSRFNDDIDTHYYLKSLDQKMMIFNF
jgi:DNA polymerase elongation subunit (family B)